MNGFDRLFVYLPALMLAAGSVVAQEADTKAVVDTKLNGKVVVAPTAAEAEAAFQAAREGYMAIATGSPDQTVGPISTTVVEDTVAGGNTQNIALEDIRIVLDVDNASLREIMAKIVQQAAAYTGPWTVKWRLSPENSSLLDEKVNLTAEAGFDEFCSLLTERVKNMSGIQLYVTAFAGTRVLLVADTYY